mmetsp:Transcript_59499/g.134132  ORF Transcript_59499/g.134132 Transcript_59499/m.134132 type:complete len:177 (-) Transcript_59499:92-622(-)
MLPAEAPAPVPLGHPTLRSRSGGYNVIPLEVAPPVEAADAREQELDEEDGTTYRHRLLSRRLAAADNARNHRLTKKKRCLVSVFAISCVVIAALLWGWATILLLLRLNELRNPAPPMTEPAVAFGPALPEESEEPPRPTYGPEGHPAGVRISIRGVAVRAEGPMEAERGAEEEPDD